jgi:hypothetical protein
VADQPAVSKADFDRTLSFAFIKATQLLACRHWRAALALSAPRAFNLFFHKAARCSIHRRCFCVWLLLISKSQGALGKRQNVTRQRRNNKALQPTAYRLFLQTSFYVAAATSCATLNYM